MRKLNYILLSLLFFVGFSCTEDALKLNLRELDDVTIEGLENAYNIKNGDNLRIPISLHTKFGSSEDNFDFLWTMKGTRTDTVGRELVFDAPINIQTGVPHALTLKVVDKRTNIFTIARTTVTSYAEYSEGTVLITKTNNEFDLVFMKNGTGDIQENLYSKANKGEKLPASSSKVFSIDAISTQPGVYRKIVVATNDEKIGSFVAPNEFAFMGTINELFLSPLPSGKNYTLHATCNSETKEYMLINKKLYDRIMDRSSGSVNPKFNSEILCTVPPTDFDLAPHLLQLSGLYGEAIVFDNKHGRFMHCSYDDLSPKFLFFCKFKRWYCLQFF